MKRTCAYLLTSMMLITAVPAAVPAMPAMAAVHAQTEAAAVSSVKESPRFITKSGQTYCLNENGSSVKGWVQKSGKWYYFDKKDGHMITGWLKIGTRKFYLRKNGTMIEGPCWFKIGTKKYFFTQNGHVRSAWESKGGKWYYIDVNGDYVKSKWIVYAGKYYYMTASGAAATGTKTIGGRKYTFDNSCALKGSAPTMVKASAKANSASETASKASDTVSKATAAKTAASANASNTKSSTNTSSQQAKTETAPDNSKTQTSSTKKSSTTAKASDSSKDNKITKVTGKLNNVSESRKKFVIDVANYVRKYAPRYGIKVYSPVIAQAIHESGWGESSLAWKYHNYFGLKCGTLWTGKSVNLATKEEYSAGTLTTISANFRVYDNLEQGIKGYFEFIQLPRYSNLKGVKDCRQYLTNIKNDGYATGSLYVDHTMALVEMYDLTQFDK